MTVTRARALDRPYSAHGIMNHLTDGGLLVGGVFAALSACALDGIGPRAALYVVLSGHWVYGRDRAMDGKCAPSAGDVALLCGSFAASLAILATSGPQAAAVAPLQVAVPLAYIPFKRRFPLLKPAYVAAGWTCASLLVPCLLEEHERPDPGTASAVYALSWSESTRMDCDDIEEDVGNGIRTLPAIIGPDKASLACDVISAAGAGLALAASHPHPPTVPRLMLATSAAAPAIRRLSNAVRTYIAKR